MADPIADLQKKYGIADKVTFDKGRGSLPRVVVTGPLSSGEVYLHGAHITAFQPTGQKPFLFVAEKSLFAPGEAIRGGIPICFPWFAERKNDPKAPRHGFVRTMEWAMKGATAQTDGTIELRFELASNPTTRNLWPEDFQLVYVAKFGKTLQVDLTITNTGRKTFKVEEALHTYFAVGDAAKATVEGLDGTRYLDKTRKLALSTQIDPRIRINGEVDRMYLDVNSTCVLDDRAWDRRVSVAKKESDSTVVWNPYAGHKLSDAGPDEWKNFICVETANIDRNAIEVAIGASHTMSLIVGLETA